MHGRRGQPLLDAVDAGLVFDRGDGNHMNAFRQRVAAPGHVIAATNTRHQREQKYIYRKEVASGEWRVARKRSCHSSFSASFTAFAAGNRMLSAAPQNHQLAACKKSACGFDNWILVSPAALILLGPIPHSSMIANPDCLQACVILSLSAPSVSCAHAENVTP